MTCNAIAPRAWTRLVATIPQQRPGREPISEEAPDPNSIQNMEPEMIAPMVCYLATDNAWNINGQVFMDHGEHTGVLAGATLRS